MSTESVDDAVADAVNNQADAAEAATEAAKAESARHIAEASANAATAAQTAADLAKVQAAETINENKENLEWLRQHATNVDTSLNQLQENQRQLTDSIPSLLEQHQNKMMETLKPLLTQPISAPNEIQNVAPENLSAEEDAQREAEQKIRDKPKRGPKYKGNWT